MRQPGRDRPGALRGDRGASQGPVVGDDILSLLVANSDLTDAELRDEVITLLIAGHETTSTALAWAFERLTRHPGRDGARRRPATTTTSTPW